MNKFESYKKVRVLGKGSFGKAFLVKAQSDDGLYVIKQIDMEGMSREDEIESFKEAKIMRKLDHPNIVRFKEVYRTKGHKLCIVMEYADGGDLNSVVKETKEQGGSFEESLILHYFT